MAYSFTENHLGYLQIANTDAGISTTSPSGTVTTIPTPPATLGMIARAFDATLGEGEFICLLGVAGTAIGSLVTYASTTYQTALCPSTANLAQPVAVAMSANLAATFGWYQISGSATVLKQVNHQVPAGAVGIGTSAGKITSSASAGAGKEIENARKTASGTAASAATTCVIIINRPHAQGRIT